MTHLTFYPRLMISLMIILFLFCISWLTPGCLYEIVSPHPDVVVPVVVTPPEPIVIDTCEEYIEITDPAFVNTTVEITDFVATPIIVIAGSYSDTVALTTQIGSTVDSLMKLFKPAYQYTTYAKQSDPRTFTTLIDGTNDHQQFLLKCLVKYNGLKHYFGAASQAFYFGGALDADQVLNTSIKYPSFDRANDRGTAFDSITQERIDTTRLGRSICKAGREWWDFRWGIHADSIIQLAIDAGWNTVLSSAPDDGYVQGQTINLSDQRADDQMILYYLKLGYQVITRE